MFLFMNWGCTVEKHAYVCRIEFFPPKINVNFQLNYIYHILSLYIGHFVLLFEKESMATYLPQWNLTYIFDEKNSIWHTEGFFSKVPFLKWPFWCNLDSKSFLGQILTNFQNFCFQKHLHELVDLHAKFQPKQTTLY